MIWVHFTETEFHSWLTDHGCKTVDFDDSCLDDHIMVYKGSNGDLVPIQMMKVYYGFYVTKVCTDLGIPIPFRFIHLKNQLDNLKKIQSLRPEPGKEEAGKD